MSTELKIIENNELDLAIGSNKVSELGNPFRQKMYLDTIHITGTKFVENIKEIYSKVNVGDTVKLIREHDNIYDELATRVETLDGEELGYIPQNENHIIARLLDYGKNLSAEVKTKNDYAYVMHIDIFMED